MTMIKTTIGIVAAAMMADALLGRGREAETEVDEVVGKVVVEVGEWSEEAALLKVVLCSIPICIDEVLVDCGDEAQKVVTTGS